MLWKLFQFAIFAALSGCAAIQQADLQKRGQGAKEQMQIEVANCPQKGVARARCINEVEDRTIKPFNTFEDLYRLNQAYRLALANRVESGQMQQPEAELEFARAHSELTAEYERRVLARQSVGAQVASAQAQQSVAMSNIIANLSRRPTSVTCTQTGPTVTCH